MRKDRVKRRAATVNPRFRRTAARRSLCTLSTTRCQKRGPRNVVGGGSPPEHRVCTSIKGARVSSHPELVYPDQAVRIDVVRHALGHTAFSTSFKLPYFSNVYDCQCPAYFHPSFPVLCFGCLQATLGSSSSVLKSMLRSCHLRTIIWCQSAETKFISFNFVCHYAIKWESNVAQSQSPRCRCLDISLTVPLHHSLPERFKHHTGNRDCSST